MLKKIGRLFVIKTRLEACLIIYALAVGAMARGAAYLHEYPGYGGKLLLLACTGSVFLAGAKIFDCLRYEQAAEAARQASSPSGLSPVIRICQGTGHEQDQRQAGPQHRSSEEDTSALQALLRPAYD